MQNRTGFETMASLGPYAPFVFVEALDANGTVLGTSSTNGTFVPNQASAANCTETACGPGFSYTAVNAQVCT